jgi:phosphatidylglycerophosphate synthase
MSHDTHPGVAPANAYSPRTLTEGERWTAAALSDLRRRGYRPRAWKLFLGDSLARARDTRRARPGLVRQSRAWSLTGAAAWLAACRLADRSTTVTLPRRAGLVWWLAVWQMLNWHLGMAEGDDGQPNERLSPADAMTLVRFWLVPVLPATRHSNHALAIIIVTGGVTDALDGRVARRRGRTRLGRDLDTTADLAFVLTAAACTHAAGRLPTAAGWALGARCALGVAASLAAFFGRGRRPTIQPRPWGAPLRVLGLALCAADRTRPGAALLIAGCLVPPHPSYGNSRPPGLPQPATAPRRTARAPA